MLDRINTTYGNHARFDAGRGMTEDEIFKIAPSVFAVTAHESRSERFAPIPTIEIVRGLKKEGFEVVGVKQGKSRVPGKADFTKHLLRLRRMDADTSFRVGDTVVESLLKNANDGTAQYELLSALWRIRCMNSLVAHMGTIDTVKVRHTGKDIVNKVIEGTYSVVENSKLALAAPQDWAQIQLDRDEKLAFAEAARAVRFADAEGNVNTPIQADQLLQVRRRDDQENNLWTNFNVIQENVIRGGLHGVTVDANNVRRNVSTRQVNGIDQDVKLNRALWILAQRMAELKGWKEAA